MSVYELLVLTVAIGVFLLSIIGGNIRGAAWITAICFDVVLSDAYSTSGLPYPEAAMAVLDFSVCIAIWFFAAKRWELWLFVLLQFSMLVSIVDLGAGIISPGWIDRELYLLVLELINYAVLLLIGGVSGFAIAGRIGGGAFAPWSRVLSFSGLVRGKIPTDRR